MKYVLILLICILLIPCSLAGEKALVKSGTYKPGDVFTVENKLDIEIDDINNENAVTLNIGEERLKISAGDCVERLGYEICLTTITQSDQKHPRFDIFLYDYVIDVYRDIARVTVTQTPELTKMSKGDRFKVVVTFENHGEKKAEDITWSQSLSGFKAYDSKEGCFFTENKVGWSGMLFPDRSMSCSYFLEATTPGKQTLTGTLQWTDDKLKTVETSLKLEVAEFDLVVTPVLGKTTIILGETTDLILQYKNILLKDDLDDVITTIPIQPGVTIIPSEPTFTKPHEVTWNDFLRLQEEKEVKLKIKGDAYGYFTIPIMVEYNTKGKKQEFEIDVPIEVKAPSMSFAIQPKEVQSSESVRIKLTTSNQNIDDLTSVSLSINSEAFSTTFEKAFLRKGESVVIYEGEITPIHTDIEQDMSIKIQGTFLFQGQTVAVNEEVPLKKLPKQDVIIAPVEEVPIPEENKTEEETTSSEMESQKEAEENYKDGKMTQIMIGITAILIIIIGFICLRWWKRYQQEQKIIKGDNHEHSQSFQATEERHAHSRKEIADQIEKLTKK